ncbi:MAG: peptidylprolyl isomerase [Bacteroidota bacterium]|nr:peptidylprolyl isomerase [Bacteroidota bacterium]
MKYQKLSFAFSLLAVLLVLTSSYTPLPANGSEEKKVMITTDMGIIKIKLYNETPLHRDNFLKLVKQHYFDSLLFHRIIQNFMIQGGDPDSKNAKPEAELGNGGPAYTIPAEINPKLFHKKGVLAAARDSDWDNPMQASSGSQFYIVQGKIHNDSTLDFMSNRITKMMLMNVLMNKPENSHLLKKYKEFNKAEKADSIKSLQSELKAMAEAELPKVAKHKFTPDQIQAYKTIGGTPHLDRSYTVFGEVYEGLDVLDKIAAVECGENDRPKKDVRILSITVVK